MPEISRPQCLLAILILITFSMNAFATSKVERAQSKLSGVAAPKKSFHFEPRDRQEPPLIFDIPVAYNEDVRQWIKYFQGNGRVHFKRWLERSNKYLPNIQKVFREVGLPRDLAYMAMIESGFSTQAVSTASAVGPWQFIDPTARQYGLQINNWIDERRDFDKSTRAATKYLRNLYTMFNAWHLVAAGYNAGENYIARLVKKNGTKNFWTLAERGLHDETKNYVPKLIAAVLIAKAPNLYGFRDLNLDEPLDYDSYNVPGGTRLQDLAAFLGVTDQYMRELNPDLLRGYIPPHIARHTIRIPKGSSQMVSNYLRTQLAAK